MIYTLVFTYRILHPLVFGEYPKLMRKNAGSRLPIFTKAESSLVKGSADFIGIIHYQNWHVMDDPQSLMMETRDLVADVGAKMMSMCFFTLKYHFKAPQKFLNFSLCIFNKSNHSFEINFILTWQKKSISLFMKIHNVNWVDENVSI